MFVIPAVDELLQQSWSSVLNMGRRHLKLIALAEEAIVLSVMDGTVDDIGKLDRRSCGHC